VALAAGFGLDFTTCEPEVFDELLDLLHKRGRKEKRDGLAQDLKARMG
jgi:hypothetical protein